MIYLISLLTAFTIMGCLTSPEVKAESKDDVQNNISSSIDVSSSSNTIPISSSSNTIPISSSSNTIPISSQAVFVDDAFSRYYTELELYYLVEYPEANCYSNNAVITANIGHQNNMKITGTFLCQKFDGSSFEYSLDSDITSIVAGESSYTIDNFPFKMFTGVENNSEIINIQWFGQYSTTDGDFRFWYNKCNVAGSYLCYDDPINGITKLYFHFRS